jgi:hypothetical protein
MNGLPVFYPRNFAFWLQTLAAVTLMLATAQFAKADEHTEALDLLITEQRRMEAYGELDYAQKELMHHQASTILATYGGYNSYKADGAGDSAFGSDLMRLRNRLGGPWPQALAAFRRTTSRDKTLSPNDLTLVEDSIALMDELLAAGAEIVELCEADKAYDASLVYRDRSMPAAAELTRLLYSLNAGASSRFKKTAMKAKY